MDEVSAYKVGANEILYRNPVRRLLRSLEALLPSTGPLLILIYGEQIITLSPPSTVPINHLMYRQALILDPLHLQRIFISLTVDYPYEAG